QVRPAAGLKACTTYRLNAATAYHSRTCRTGRRRHDLAVLDDGADRVRPDANQIDCRAVDNHRIHLSARFEAADAIVAIDGVRRVDRRGDERFLEGEPHAEAGERH